MQGVGVPHRECAEEREGCRGVTGHGVQGDTCHLAMWFGLNFQEPPRLTFQGSEVCERVEAKGPWLALPWTCWSGSGVRAAQAPTVLLLQGPPQLASTPDGSWQDPLPPPAGREPVLHPFVRKSQPSQGRGSS